jgi:hypothetical protein
MLRNFVSPNKSRIRRHGKNLLKFLIVSNNNYAYVIMPYVHASHQIKCSYKKPNDVNKLTLRTRKGYKNIVNKMGVRI